MSNVTSSPDAAQPDPNCLTDEQVRATLEQAGLRDISEHILFDAKCNLNSDVDVKNVIRIAFIGARAEVQRELQSARELILMERFLRKKDEKIHAEAATEATRRLEAEQNRHDKLMGKSLLGNIAKLLDSKFQQNITIHDEEAKVADEPSKQEAPVVDKIMLPSDPSSKGPVAPAAPSNPASNKEINSLKCIEGHVMVVKAMISLNDAGSALRCTGCKRSLARQSNVFTCGHDACGSLCTSCYLEGVRS